MHVKRILSQEILRSRKLYERQNQDYGLSTVKLIENQELLFQMSCDGLQCFWREIWPDSGTAITGNYILGMKRILNTFHGDLASNCQEILLWTDRLKNQLGTVINWARRMKMFDIQGKRQSDLIEGWHIESKLNRPGQVVSSRKGKYNQNVTRLLQWKNREITERWMNRSWAHNNIRCLRDYI